MRHLCNSLTTLRRMCAKCSLKCLSSLPGTLVFRLPERQKRFLNAHFRKNDYLIKAIGHRNTGILHPRAANVGFWLVSARSKRGIWTTVRPKHVQCSEIDQILKVIEYPKLRLSTMPQLGGWQRRKTFRAAPACTLALTARWEAVWGNANSTLAVVIPQR